MKNLRRENGSFSEKHSPQILKTLEEILQATNDENLVSSKILISKFFEKFLKVNNHQITFSDTKQVIIEKFLEVFRSRHPELNDSEINQLLIQALDKHSQPTQEELSYIRSFFNLILRRKKK